jgi:hypothetical protein
MFKDMDGAEVCILSVLDVGASCGRSSIHSGFANNIHGGRLEDTSLFMILVLVCQVTGQDSQYLLGNDVGVDGYHILSCVALSV